MKFYSDIRKISLPKEVASKAWAFAREVTSTTNYSDSNQSSVKKIRIDHYISKLGEEAAKIILSDFGEVRGPDYKIYCTDEKSWEEDLFINDIGIAVKTQSRTAAIKYSLSWTFQSGTLRKDSILQKPEAWVIFVECDDTCPYDFYVYPPFQIKDLVFEEPKLRHLKGHKKVVYAKTLKIKI